MYPHNGHWQVSDADPSDVIFSTSTGATGATVALTITKPFGTEQVPILVNGSDLSPNGTLDASETARTFRLTGVTSIAISVASSPSPTVSGSYSITVAL